MIAVRLFLLDTALLLCDATLLVVRWFDRATQ